MKRWFRLACGIAVVATMPGCGDLIQLAVQVSRNAENTANDEAASDAVEHNDLFLEDVRFAASRVASCAPESVHIASRSGWNFTTDACNRHVVLRCRPPHDDRPTRCRVIHEDEQPGPSESAMLTWGSSVTDTMPQDALFIASRIAECPTDQMGLVSRTEHTFTAEGCGRRILVRCHHPRDGGPLRCRELPIEEPGS